MLPAGDAVAARFAQVLAPYLETIELCSFEPRVLVEARRLAPELATTFLFKEPTRVVAGAPTIGPRHDLVTRELIEAAHAAGVRVVPWTVDDGASWLRSSTSAPTASSRTSPRSRGPSPRRAARSPPELRRQ